MKDAAVQGMSGEEGTEEADMVEINPEKAPVDASAEREGGMTLAIKRMRLHYISPLGESAALPLTSENEHVSTSDPLATRQDMRRKEGQNERGTAVGDDVGPVKGVVVGSKGFRLTELPVPAAQDFVLPCYRRRKPVVASHETQGGSQQHQAASAASVAAAHQSPSNSHPSSAGIMCSNAVQTYNNVRPPTPSPPSQSSLCASACQMTVSERSTHPLCSSLCNSGSTSAACVPKKQRLRQKKVCNICLLACSDWCS